MLIDPPATHNLLRYLTPPCKYRGVHLQSIAFGAVYDPWARPPAHRPTYGPPRWLTSERRPRLLSKANTRHQEFLLVE